MSKIMDKIGCFKFTLQKGPIREVGLNGCQIDAMIRMSEAIITGLDELYPCAENKEIISHLQQAQAASASRKANRESRGVEGTSTE
jgi:hypothetical protein